jgi:hypothetical protein
VSIYIVLEMFTLKPECSYVVGLSEEKWRLLNTSGSHLISTHLITSVLTATV